MKLEVAKAYINLRWADILIVNTEQETDFTNISFAKKEEVGDKIIVTTYITRPAIWKHYFPGHDASNPDTHKYLFIIEEQRTEVFENETLAEYSEALNVLGVETEGEEVTENA